MGYFPFFVQLSDQAGLIIGGGTVALRKVEKLMPYGPRLTVVAPSVLPELEKMSCITVLREAFSPAMLEGKTFVVAATNDVILNQSIAVLCRERGIPVNVVDTPELCTFLFPAVVKQGSLSVGISTEGTSPSAAVWLKEQINKILPEQFEEILDYLGAMRLRLKETIPEANRAKVYSRLFDVCIAQGRPLTEEELSGVLEETL